MARHEWKADTEPTWSIRHEYPKGHPNAEEAVDYTGASAWSLKLVSYPSRETTVLVKTTGITGYSDDSPLSGWTAADKPPNVVAVFATTELAAVTPGTYFIECTPTVSGVQPVTLVDTVDIKAAAPAVA